MEFRDLQAIVFSNYAGILSGGCLLIRFFFCFSATCGSDDEKNKENKIIYIVSGIKALCSESDQAGVQSLSSNVGRVSEAGAGMRSAPALCVSLSAGPRQALTWATRQSRRRLNNALFSRLRRTTSTSRACCSPASTKSPSTCSSPRGAPRTRAPPSSPRPAPPSAARRTNTSPVPGRQVSGAAVTLREPQGVTLSNNTLSFIQASRH